MFNGYWVKHNLGLAKVNQINMAGSTRFKLYLVLIYFDRLKLNQIYI